LEDVAGGSLGDWDEDHDVVCVDDWLSFRGKSWREGIDEEGEEEGAEDAALGSPGGRLNAEGLVLGSECIRSVC